MYDSCRDEMNAEFCGVLGVLVTPAGIRACSTCKKYSSDAEAKFAYYSQRSIQVQPTIHPDDFQIDTRKLIRMYAEQPYFVERLPYTKIFESMVEVIGKTPYIVYNCLISLRKQGRLPPKR